MEEAHHIRDGRIYAAADIDRWSRDDRDALRGQLRCPECGAIAYFRRGSRDGKRPCFFATAHTQACETAVRHSPGRAEKHTLNRIERIIEAGVALPLGGKHLPAIDQVSASGGPAARPRGHTVPPEPHESSPCPAPLPMMRALLDYIEHDPAFVDSQAEIETDGGYTWRACNLFVHFEDATPEKRPHLYWGRVTDIDINYHWLNTGSRHAASIDLQPLREDPLGWLGVQDPETDIPGARVLVFGWCVAGRRGKPIIKINDRDAAYLVLASD